MHKRFMVMGDSWGTGYVEGGPDHGGWLDVVGIAPGLRLAVNGTGIHPNAAGHEALGKFIKEAIAS